MGGGEVDFLDAIVFGDGLLPAEKPEESKEVKKDASSESGGGQHIDVLKNKRLRKLMLTAKDLDNADRLPAKRYLTDTEFQERLMAKVKNQAKGPSWIDLARQRSAQNGGMVKAKGQVISGSRAGERSGILKTFAEDDLTLSQKHQSRCSSVGFRERDSNSKLLFSTGPDKCVKFYKVAQGDSELICSTHIKKSPIWTAAWSSDKSSLYCVSDRSDMIAIDVETRAPSKFPSLLGRDRTQNIKQVLSFDNIVCVLDDRGKIYQLDERTRRTVRVYNSASCSKAVCFHPDDTTRLYSGDDRGELFTWDLTAGRCVQRTALDGVLCVTALSAGPDGQLIVGAKSGHISVHDRLQPRTAIRCFDNLQSTAISVLRSHRPSGISVAASSHGVDAARLVQTRGPSMCVYQNWPGVNAQVGRLTCADFSETGGWLAGGTEQGIVKLWRIPDLD